MADTPADPSDSVEATTPEDDGDYDADVGAPLDSEYLARLSPDADS